MSRINSQPLTSSISDKVELDTSPPRLLTCTEDCTAKRSLLAAVDDTFDYIRKRATWRNLHNEACRRASAPSDDSTRSREAAELWGQMTATLVHANILHLALKDVEFYEGCIAPLRIFDLGLCGGDNQLRRLQRLHVLLQTVRK